MSGEENQQARAQTNITWKGDNKQIFQAAFDAWAQDKPRTAGAGEYVIDLIRKASTANKAIEANSRLEALGIAELVEMHRRRMEADDRMLEQIADLIADAKGKAKAEVGIELETLQKSKASLEASVEKLTGELEKLRQELETVKSELEKATTEREESGRQCEQLQAELERVKGQLAQATLASEKASGELEREKLAAIALKEKAVAHDRELNALQKKADEAEIAYKEQVHNLERQKAEIEATHRQEILQMEALKQKELTEQVQAQFKLNAELEKAKNNWQQLHDKMEESQKFFEDSKKAFDELASAQITIAKLEATVTGQKESLANFAKAFDVMSNFKPVQMPELPKMPQIQKQGKNKEQA